MLFNTLHTTFVMLVGLINALWWCQKTNRLIFTYTCIQKATFYNCSCLDQSNDSTSSVTPGFCPLETGCKKHFVYLLLLFVASFLAAMTTQLFTYAILW